jgi:hypothetical protein
MVANNYRTPDCTKYASLKVKKKKFDKVNYLLTLFSSRMKIPGPTPPATK